MDQSIFNLQDNVYGQVFIFLITVWSLAWKGVALWKASKNNQRNWYILLLILNTAGIVEIIYIYFFQKKLTKPKTGKGKAKKS